MSLTQTKSGLFEMQNTFLVEIIIDTVKALQTLNLVGTKVTGSGLPPLKDLKDLQSFYLHQTNVQEGELEQLKKIFPKSVTDLGGYATILPYTAK